MCSIAETAEKNGQCKKKGEKPVVLLAKIFEELNNYSGLFALLAFLAAAIVPFCIYRNQKKDDRRAMKDELDAMNDISQFPMSHEEREYYTKKRKFEKGLRRK